MTDKKNDKFLSLYPEDFVGKIWIDVCDVLDISPDSTEARIYFGSEDVLSELPKDDDDYKKEF